MTGEAPPRVSLPERTVVDLPGRAKTAVYDSGIQVDNPDLAPVVLLHGWNINSFVNFGFAYESLAAQRRVVMVDHRGHGLGAETTGRFSLEECSDDVVAVLDALGIDRAIVVGYSLGGAVAQLLGHRSPDRVVGLVLAATSERFGDHLRVRGQFTILDIGSKAMRVLPGPIKQQVFRLIATIACLRYPTWVRDQVLECDPVSLLEAGACLGAFDSTDWIDSLDVPVANLVTLDDRVVQVAAQYQLAGDAQSVLTIPIHADHDIVIRNDQRFTDALLNAIDRVDAARNDTAAVAQHALSSY